jgi:hypothetical protein
LKTKSGFVWLVALLNTWSITAIVPDYPDARAYGMGHAGVMLAGVNADFGNPAGLASLTCPAFSMHYSNPFLMPELGSGAFCMGIPAIAGAFGIQYASLGNTYINESRVSISYGKSVGKRIRAGIGLYYWMFRQPTGFGNLSVLSPSLGLQILPWESLTIGLAVINPAGQNYNPAGYLRLPVIVRAGFGYQLGEEVLICFEAEKRSMDGFEFRGGIELNLHKSVILRFGISAGNFPAYYFGMGLHLRSLSMDLAAGHHPVLGYSPAITLTYSVNRGKGGKKQR